MLEHDFYADPTVFDQWQNEAGNWLCARFRKLCPYAWVIGFSVLGFLFLSVAAGVFIYSLQAATSADLTSVLNESLAQCVTLVMALIATQTLFKQALAAWPEHIELPARLRAILGYVGLQKTVTMKPRKASGLAQKKAVAVKSEREVLQDFFAGVRAAGVNVSIAKALFAAGVRSSHQLCQASDEQLHAIRGVGPATVRKLRLHFNSR
jgi:hypothetical protein